MKIYSCNLIFILDKKKKKKKINIHKTKMAKNIFISNLPINPVREMVSIWWKFGEIESFVYIKNKNLVS